LRPRPASCGGYTLIELLFAIVLIALLAAISVSELLVSLDRSRSLAAARYLASRMLLARAQAVSRAATVALRFEDTPEGIRVGVFIDRNRNGVRTSDIQTGIDTPLDQPLLVSALFAGVTVDVPQGTSRLFSFTPSGTATSGTVYVHGRDGSRFAVRVLGATARARVLQYIPAGDIWIEAS
jgi:prepilin-type N-terminal cleavage/methylation domain-containing protein